MDKLSILKVLKPQGLKGELKCLPLTERTEVFDGLNSAFCDGKEVRIISSKYRLGFVYICIENVNSIDDAEKWRGKEFFVDKEQKKPSRRLFVLGKKKNLMERKHNQ